MTWPFCYLILNVLETHTDVVHIDRRTFYKNMTKDFPKDYSPGRILVIQLRQIGDVLLTTPSLRALRKRFPEAYIAYLSEPLAATVLEGNENIDEVIVRDPKEGGLEPLRTIVDIRKRGFDLVIDFLANPRTTPITFFSKAKTTISYADNRRRMFYTHPVMPEPGFTAGQKLSLLRVLGCGPEPLDLDMAVPERAKKKIREFVEEQGLDQAPRPLVCVEPFHKRPVREYPGESFRRLSELMVEEWGATVVVCWGPGREAEARAIVDNAKVGLIMAPPTDLHEMAELYGKADLWLGNDCGPRHIAASQGLPTFALIGPTDDAWTPPGPRHISESKDIPCRPCNKRYCPEEHHDCMKGFTPEEVFERLAAFWESVKS